jgi:hypothetical protein
MRKLAAASCASIDFLCVKGCVDCTQETWSEAVRTIGSITGKDGYHGISLTLMQTPGISSLMPLEGVTGLLHGGLLISAMDGLADLQGLENIKEVGSDHSFDSVTIYRNSNLRSVMALNKTSFGPLSMSGNSEALCDVPVHWPEKDKHKFRLRSVKCSSGQEL